MEFDELLTKELRLAGLDEVRGVAVHAGLVGQPRHLVPHPAGQLGPERVVDHLQEWKGARTAAAATSARAPSAAPSRVPRLDEAVSNLM